MFKTARLTGALLGAVYLAPFAALADSSSITIAGSTAMLPLVKAAAESYQASHPEVRISVTGGGSRVGITQVAAKAVDLGDSDVLAKGYPALRDHRVAVTGFALLVNPDVGVSSLTKQQIRDVFSGKVVNWKSVGGKDENVVLINRPRSSGTRAVFARTLMGGIPMDESGLVEDATGTTADVVSSTPGAISYAAFSGVRGREVRLLNIDGVAPLDKNVASGKYAFWSYEHIFTNGAPGGAAAQFLAFLCADRSLAHQMGYIPIGDMKVTENDR